MVSAHNAAGGWMLGKWTLLSLAVLTFTAHAESQRREPSLFLGYERDLKKSIESEKEETTAFIKNPLPPVSVVKPAVPAVPVVKAVVAQDVSMPILKNAKIETDEIGHEEKPFLVVSKPAPATSPNLCSDEKKPTAVSSKEGGSIVKNLKNAKEKVLSKAKEFLGTPYGFGNKSGMQTDCSGFTQQVYSQFGISLPRSAAEQAQLGMNVDPSDLQVGDLLFYRTYKSDPSHVAIYAGDGKIIHASYTAKKVQYDSIDKDYYKQRFLYARRLAFNESQSK